MDKEEYCKQIEKVLNDPEQKNTELSEEESLLFLKMRHMEEEQSKRVFTFMDYLNYFPLGISVR